MKKVEDNKFKFRINDKVKVLDDIWGYNTTNKVGIIKHFDITNNNKVFVCFDEDICQFNNKELVTRGLWIDIDKIEKTNNI